MDSLIVSDTFGVFFVADLLTAIFLLAQVLFVTAVSAFALSAVDDLLLDVFLLIRKVFRRGGRNKNEDLPEDFLSQEERYLAIMLPAWQESGILLPSVSKIISTLQYTNYHIFIGTYPNDEETQKEADLLAAKYAHVHKVVTPLPGPTCKADCLNAVIEQIEAFAQGQDIEFSGFILQDAEDIVHPLSLKLFNHYLADYDLIQIPVFSLPRSWRDLTGGHYMDEFAEVHSKEVKARQYLAGVVPGAGVGTAYSRKVIQFAAEHGEIFNTSSLTEDYEFSFRLRSAGFKMIFARMPMTAVDPQADPREIIATRELFPNRFWAAVRQKTRWIIGISLQGWSSLGWQGSWRVRFIYWRDRKTLFFSHAVVAGFVATLIFSLFLFYEASFPDGYRMAPLLDAQSPFWHVVYFNISVLAYRLVQRCYWTFHCYGWSQVPMVIPRYVWGALINYLATVRAIRIYLLHLLTGQPIGWDKTTHDFPDEMPMVEPDVIPVPVEAPVAGFVQTAHGGSRH